MQYHLKTEKFEFKVRVHHSLWVKRVQLWLTLVWSHGESKLFILCYINTVWGSGYGRHSHTGYDTISLWSNELWLIVQRITMKTCRIRYENVCRTGAHNLVTSSLKHHISSIRSPQMNKWKHRNFKRTCWLLLNRFIRIVRTVNMVN